MRRKEIAESFLAEAYVTVNLLDEMSWTDDQRLMPLDQVKVFQALTMLKRVLEALAGDIFETISDSTLSDAKKKAGKKGHSYGMFPYGLIENDFRSRIGSTHPQLVSQRKDVYDLLESVQPYRLNQTTICDLFNNRNTAEHDNLEQTVTLSERTRIEVGRGMIIENSSGVVRNGIIDGKPAPDFKIDSSGRPYDIIGDSSMMSVKQKKDVTLTDTGTNLLVLLQESYRVISRLKEDVYQLL